jgi:hypothetical protein
MTGHDEYTLASFLRSHGLAATLEAIARLHDPDLLKSKLTMREADIALLRSALANLVIELRKSERSPQISSRIAEAMAVLSTTRLDPDEG